MNDVTTTVLVPLLGYVVYYVQLFLKSKLAPKTLALVIELAEKSVAAAEEVGRATKVPSSEKFAVAAEMLRDSAKRTGVKLSSAEVAGYVHAALRDMREYHIRDMEMP